MKPKPQITLLLLIPFLFCNSFICAQLKQGQCSIGGASFDVGYSIIQTHDKGFAIAGYTDSYISGGEGLYLVKLDSAGNLAWTKVIGSKMPNMGHSLTETYDQGLAISGMTSTFGASSGNPDVYVVKLDATGNLKWTKTIGGPGDDEGYSIIQTYDKGLVVAGYSKSYGAGNYDIYVVKLDSAGNLKWTKTIGGAGDDEGYSVVQTSDKGIAIAGYTNSYGAGNYDIYVVKLDSAGNLKWTKTIGGSGYEFGYSIVQTFDKGLVIAGMTNSYGAGNYDDYIVKLDSAGNLKWTKVIGGQNYEYSFSVIQSSDKGIVATGMSSTYGIANDEVYVVKLDSAGNLKWTQAGGGNGFEWGYSLCQTIDKGFAITGYTDSYGAGNYDVDFIKLDSAGNFCTAHVTDSGKVTTGGTLGAGGGSISSGGNTNSGDTLYIGGTLTQVCNIITALDNQIPMPSITLSPNPADKEIRLTVSANPELMHFEVSIYDITGRRVISKNISSSRQNILDISSLGDGIYLCDVVKYARDEANLVMHTKFIVHH